MRILLSCVLLLIGTCVKAQAVETRPNIVLFLGDNWAAPHAGILGDPVAQTPVFDKIAREGVLFRNAFCPVPSCSPTRSSVLTGRAAHQLEDAASLWSIFPRHLVVFSDLLRDAGYEIAFCGKGWSPGIYKDYGRTENPAGKEYPSFDDFMSQRDPSKPFFFWVGNMDVALHQWRKSFGEITDEEMQHVVVPPELPDVPATRRDIAAYYRGIAKMDSVAAATVDRLDRDRLYDQTMFIYASDNGWQMPRGLANCYDSGTHVPLAVRWPRQTKAGRTVDDFVSLTDLAPTILQAAGIKPPDNMTGRSFVDLLRGDASHVVRDRVFVERERHANVRRGDLSYPIRGVRTKQFLYLRNLRPDRWPAGDPEAYLVVGDYGDVDPTLTKDYMIEHAADPSMKRLFDLSFAHRPAEELYDLTSDPAQLVNVADKPEYAAARAELSESVDQWMRDTNDPRVDTTYDQWDVYPYLGSHSAKKKVPSPAGVK